MMDRFENKILIEKGWSNDKKFCVTDREGNIFLLRISPKEQFDRKKLEFNFMNLVSLFGIPMCLPIELGCCDEGVYSIQSWIDGVDLESVAQNLTDRQKYNYGYEAGQILKKIHSISAPECSENWETRFNHKIDRKISAYLSCPIKYDHGDLFIEYVNSHRYLLSGRPICFQHGDYHVGNMMLADGKLYIIDFNRFDFGDPWEEFNRIVWSAEAAPEFARGTIDGYFEGEEVPQMFWRLLALYISNNTLSALPWAIPFGEGEVEVMRKQAANILSWYDNMKTVIPSWYNKGK
jgi:aminoglycoside phosphotransferase (APT) family kinase protein